ncbi:hypothetical protein V6Z12_A02G004800 [Gossypium hirsutum]
MYIFIQFREILGKGAMKKVYKAFDEVLGMEVAWNQVKLADVFRSPDELQRLYSEIHLLNYLDHSSIMQFYESWIDIHRKTFNFVNRDGRQRVDIRVRCLAYPHCHDPPVIHRDLKCNNIFVHGHLGQVKIGDLGLAAILHGSKHAHSVIGTPEFMALELYEEEYNELIDIYSFGMCMLEMLTSQYPSSKCSNPAQIYKKVTLVRDGEAWRFRLHAYELLLDPFLASDEENSPKFLPFPCVLSQKQNMLITATMDPADDKIFLKVQIIDNEGHARNIYFPFDIVNDTAINIASEMVKELEINDREPLGIANMIEKEISSLIPQLGKTGDPIEFITDTASNDFDSNLRQGKLLDIPKTVKSTRFCLSESTSSYSYKQYDAQPDSWRSLHINGQRKLPKIRSLVDIGSRFTIT